MPLMQNVPECRTRSRRGLGAGPADLGGFAVELRDDSGEAHLFGFPVDGHLQALQHAAGVVVLVVGDLHGVVDLADGHTGGAEFGDDVVGVTHRCP